MRQWVRRAAELHGELAAIADVSAAHWWVVAGGAALDLHADAAYLVSDAEPSSDTFIGHASAPPADVVADAIARAHAARLALRELDGSLPDQPLAVTVQRSSGGALIVPSTLAIAAFAIGDRCWCARLADRIEDEAELAAALRVALAGRPPHRMIALDATNETPFVCVSLGDEPIELARHGHRRAWRCRPSGLHPHGGLAHDRLAVNDVMREDDARGPWLGLGRAGGLALVSTCHLVVDGYGHARLASRISDLTTALAIRVPRLPIGSPAGDAPTLSSLVSLASGDGVEPLAVAWRLLPTGVRALPLAYALGCLLHRITGVRDAAFSPTFQIPVAPGSPDDPSRFRRRVVPAIASVRFARGEPEPFAAFAARTKRSLAREAAGGGLTSRLLAAARAVPAPLAWKRRAIGPGRPRWLEPVAAVIGGRGCISRIEVDIATPPSCAVSSPARLATADDPLGGCVVTVIDDGERAAITLCGSGEVARAGLLDELLHGSDAFT